LAFVPGDRDKESCDVFVRFRAPLPE
jgi:hypothetical protein